MLDIMSRAKNAIEAYNEALTISSSNIANMNVTGYKSVGISFQSIFENVLSQGSAAQDNMGGTNPEQLGQGMSVSSTYLDFSAGDLTSGRGIDLAINGQGLFIVSPDGGNNFYYTRNGNFQIDASGNLLSNNLQVYGLDGSGNVVPITGLNNYNTTLLSWGNDGTLNEYTDTTYTTISKATGYQIALTYFANPSGLMQAQGTSFAATLSSGSAAAAQAVGGAVGTVAPRQVEASNVFYIGETINSLELQRAMTGNLNMVKMASDMISSFISKLG